MLGLKNSTKSNPQDGQVITDTDEYWVPKYHRKGHLGTDTFRSRLGNNYTVILHLLLNYVGGVVRLITDGVVYSGRLRHDVIYVDLGQV